MSINNKENRLDLFQYLFNKGSLINNPVELLEIVEEIFLLAKRIAIYEVEYCNRELNDIEVKVWTNYCEKLKNIIENKLGYEYLHCEDPRGFIFRLRKDSNSEWIGY